MRACLTLDVHLNTTLPSPTYTDCQVFVALPLEGLDFVIREDADLGIRTDLEVLVMAGAEVTNVLHVVNDEAKGHAPLLLGMWQLGNHGGVHLGGAALQGEIIQHLTLLQRAAIILHF